MTDSIVGLTSETKHKKQMKVTSYIIFLQNIFVEMFVNDSYVNFVKEDICFIIL